jgi:tankyrase
MSATGDLASLAFTLDIDRLRAALKPGDALDGLLIATATAHDPEPLVQIEVIRLLIRNGADVNERDRVGVTPLHRAVRFRSPEAVRILLENGADPNAVDRRSRSSPLHRAVTETGAPSTAGKSKQVEEIVKLLLAHGADPTLRNKAGKTPRDYVRRPEIDRLLVG